MELNGWHFSWNDGNSFLTLPNSHYCGGVPRTSYCGFQYPGDALLSLTLVGSGSGTLDFGNSWRAGIVWAHLNGDLLGSADPGNLSVVVNFTFGYGDEIQITETGDGVNVINSLSFTCQSDRPRRWLTAMTAGNLRICADVTVCSSMQYQLSAATPTSDTVCMPISSCLAGLQHQMSAATATTDTACNPVVLVPCITAAPAHTVSKGASISTTSIVGGVSAAVLVIAVVATVLARQNRLPRPRHWFQRPGRTYAVVSGVYDGDSPDVGDTNDDGTNSRNFVMHEAEVVAFDNSDDDELMDATR
jgi:hypothetical protein